METQFRRLRLAGATLALALLVAISAAQPAYAFRDRDCSDFSTQAQAQRFFNRHHPNRDPHRLDGDDDRLACEALP